MIAPIIAIEPITCKNSRGQVVRTCFDVVMADKYGSYLVENVPSVIGVKLQIGALFNAPVEVGLDSNVDGAE